MFGTRPRCTDYPSYLGSEDDGPKDNYPSPADAAFMDPPAGYADKTHYVAETGPSHGQVMYRTEAPNQIVFEIEVDSEPKWEPGKYSGYNLVAACGSQKSGIVRIPQKYCAGYRCDDHGRWLVSAILDMEWLDKSHQEAVCGAASKKLVLLAASLIK